MRHVPVRRHGQVVAFALVDDADYERLVAHSWHLHTGGYARTCIKGRMTYMHRLVADAAAGQAVDHINGVPLDNRSTNLRFVTQAANTQNVCGRGGTSRYRGVSWCSRTQRWFAKARVNGKQYFLGRFDDELAAARAAAGFRREHMPDRKSVV